MVITGKAEAVAGAYVKARSEIQTLLTMDGQGARSKYPTLANILDSVTPILISHGLVIMQETTSNEFGVGVSTSLLHSSGSSIDFAPLTMQPADLQAADRRQHYHVRKKVFAHQRGRAGRWRRR